MPGHKKFSPFVKHIAIPSDHGAWIFLLSPLLIGLFASPSWSIASAVLIIASAAGFLVRQPITILVKVYAKRRPQRDRNPALFWTAAYGIIGFIAVSGLVFLGFTFILPLVIPGSLVFIWYLSQINRRRERGRVEIELAASAGLALVAPAAYWTGTGYMETTGWILFFLVWIQSGASIIYTVLRLNQRSWDGHSDRLQKIKLAKHALIFSTFNLFFVFFCGIFGFLPIMLAAPYTIQFVETIYGTFRPAVDHKPNSIGIRQLLVSVLFTLVFIISWNISFQCKI